MKHHSRKPPKRRKKVRNKQQHGTKYFRIRNKDKRKAKEFLLSLRRGQNR